MTTPVEKSPTKKESKTKADLQQELEEAFKLLEENEETLANYEVQLKDAESKTQSAEDELARVKASIDQRLAEMTSSSERLQELENQISEAQKKNELLNTQISQSEENDEKAGKDIPVSESMFRIELNAPQGIIQGEIEHPLTGDKKVFSGIDAALISEFIQKRQPQVEKAGESDTQNDIVPAKVQTSKVQRQAPQKNSPILAALIIGRSEAGIRSRQISNADSVDVYFKVENIDKKSSEESELYYKATLLARPIGRGAAIEVGDTEEIFQPENTCKVTIQPKSLSPGLYRFEAEVSFISAHGKEIYPCPSYAESEPVYVI